MRRSPLTSIVFSIMLGVGLFFAGLILTAPAPEWDLTGASIDNPPPSGELVLAFGYTNPSDECLALFSNKGDQLTREELCQTEGEVWVGVPVSMIAGITETVKLCDQEGNRCTPEAKVASFDVLPVVPEVDANLVGTQIGQIAPPVEGISLDGTITVVHFWASWCGYCVPEIPVLLDYARDFPQVQFVFIDDEPKEDMDRFLEQYSVPSNVTVIHDPESDIFYRWRVSGYPTTYVVKNGKIKTFYIGTVWANFGDWLK